jgi:AraC-like DNA-binding protein
MDLHFATFCCLSATIAMTIQVANFLNIANGLAQQIKAKVSDVLAELELTGAQVENLNAYLPWEYCRRALDLATRRTGRPHFGLHLGFNANPLIMGQDLGLFVQVCPDFRTVLREFCRHCAVMGEMTTFLFHENRHEAALRFKGLSVWRQADPDTYRAGMELNTATIVTITRQLTQNAVQIVRLEFDYPRTTELESTYRQAFGENIKLEFGHNFCAVVFAAESLQLKNPFFQEAMYNQMRSNLEIRANGYRGAIALSESIRVLLEERYFQPRQPDLHVDDVARQFNHTVRQLQRDLKSERLSFNGLRQAVKKELAMRFLLYKSNQELADLLKFADVPAVSKWFKQQFGQPPEQMRRAGPSTVGSLPPAAVPAPAGPDARGAGPTAD